MTASHLRMALAISAVVGIGIIANILQSQTGGMVGSAHHPTAPSPRLVDRNTTGASGVKASAERENLRSVRHELKARGYLKEVEVGELDSATEAAILAFEYDHGLPLTALSNASLLKTLIFTHAAVSADKHSKPQTKAARELIVSVQHALSHLGYTEAEPSGEMNNATRRAIRKFERARGLEVSGRVSAPLIGSLGPAFDEAIARGGNRNRNAG